MIRAALVSVVFLGLTLVLILMQPATDRPAATLPLVDDSAVTRAETEFEAYDALAEGLSLAGDALGTQASPAEPAIPIEAEQVSYPEPGVITPDPTALPTPEQRVTTATPLAAGDLEQLIVTALTQGQSDAYIDALVNHAAHKGKITVPDSLITADGRVDTNSLLLALQSSGLQAGLDELYVVQPGDSLAAISYRFYGNTHQAADIFNANLNILKSPGNLASGQELVIPAQ